MATDIILPNNLEISHKFQIINQNFPIPTDGILGRDFLSKYHCKIDYDAWILTCSTISGTVDIPIEDNLASSFTIPPHCEVYRQININNIKEDCVLQSSEIQPGVFCGRAILNPKNAIAKFINTTNKPIEVSKDFSKNTIPLKHYNMYTFNKTNEMDRNKNLFDELKLTNVDGKVKDKLTKLCKKFNNIFSLQGDKLTCNNFYKQSIEVTDKIPVYIKNYRAPEIHRAEITSQVDNLLEEGIIQNSTSPYNTPILLVPKKSNTKDRKYRLVCDFRQLNKKIVADKFPLTRIDDILDQLGRAKYFSTLDLTSGFHQIELDKESKKFTAFSTHQGHYEFNRLPFGLSISPNSFQRMMTIALSGLPPECAFLYIDDIIVIGCSIDHHLANLEKVFFKLQQCNLKLNPAKCNFFCADVTYLGHHISAEGIQPDKSKFSAIANYPEPQNADEVRRFVAFCNYYRRFIPYFSDITNPLNALLKKKANFIWNDNCKRAFMTLKEKLLSPKILQFPDFNKKFILSTDASKVACGAVLSQIHGDAELPVAYASKIFTKGESNKSTIEQELTAIHWAINHFRPYLYGRRFLVKTDHRPLVYLFSMKEPSSKLTRMRIDLEDFSFDIEYVKGKNNAGPDALSRVIINSEELKTLLILAVETRSKTRQKQQHSPADNNAPEIDHLNAYESVNNIDAFNLPKLVFEMQNQIVTIKLTSKTKKRELALVQLAYDKNGIDVDRCIKEVNNMAKKVNIMKVALELSSKIFSNMNVQIFKDRCNKLLQDVQIIIYKKAEVITNHEDINRLIAENHNTLLGGHVGINKLLQKLRRNYYWKNMKSTITNFVKSCVSCKMNKHKVRTNEEFVHTTTPAKAFDLISLDTVGPFTRSLKGHRYALSVQCDLSKYVIMTPLVDKQASTLARAFVENVILVYGCPKAIKTDMGSEFKNEIFENVSKILSIEQKFSTAYHPQTVGSLERNHRFLNEYLRHFINEERDDWDSWLPYYAFCYNSSPHTDHEFSPFELVFGKKVCIPSSIKETAVIEPIYNYENYAAELKFKIQKSIIKAKELLDKNKIIRIQNQAEKSNPVEININDKVWLKIENRRKLDPVYTGPFVVKSIKHPNIQIENCSSKESQIVHKNRIVRY